MYFSQLQLFISPLPSLLPLAFGHWTSTDILSSIIVYGVYLNISFPLRCVNKTQFIGKTRLITLSSPLSVPPVLFRGAIRSSFTLSFGRRCLQKWILFAELVYRTASMLNRRSFAASFFSLFPSLFVSYAAHCIPPSAIARVNFNLMDVKVRNMYYYMWYHWLHSLLLWMCATYTNICERIAQATEITFIPGYQGQYDKLRIF